MAKTFVLKDAGRARPLRIDYAKELNPEQLDVVLHGDGACLVLAGAGSGKTRTITYRVAYLLEQGVDPSSVLLLTFTNKAAREMLERVERLLGPHLRQGFGGQGEAHGIWGGTFHSIANRLLRSYLDKVGYTSGFTILDMDDSRDLIKAVLKDMHIDPKERRFPSPAVCQNIISFTRNVCGTIRDTLELKHPNFEPHEPQLVELAGRYEDRKRRSNAMDFDDLLWNLWKLLEDEETCARIAGRFRHVLVDEYQDTNALQARIVERLASAHGNVLVVGDDAQSIYAFRGADVQNILAFPAPRSFSGGGPDSIVHPRVFKLVTNYRSTPEILEVANQTLRQNLDQFEKDLVGVRPNGDKPAFIPCASSREEAQYVAEQVLQLREQGTALANIAVLFRAGAQSQQLELELLKRDVPYEYRGGQKFFERSHVKDVLAFLRVYANPQDEAAWLRVLGLQTGIGATTAAALAASVQSLPSLPRIIDSDVSHLLPGKAREGWKAFTDMARGMGEEAPHPAGMIRAIAESAYQDLLEREYPNWRERLEDLEQFALFAEGYDDLPSFLADVSLYDDVLAKRPTSAPAVAGASVGRGEDAERIILSTVHQAKGLEWDTVFIIHLADGSFPNKRALAEENGIEEERRLFYVAVTRARRRLFLSYPLTMGFDALVLNQPSQFIDDLDPRLLERIELVPSRGFRAPSSEHGWNWESSDDGPSSDDVIELDRFGERKISSVPKTKTVWKKRGT